MKHRDPVCGMEVDDRSAWRWVLPSDTYYFCAEKCLDKFSHGAGTTLADVDAARIVQPARVARVSKSVVVAAVLLGLWAAAFGWRPLVPFRDAALSYLGMIWWGVLLGILLSGVIDRCVPDDFFWRFLARPRKRTVFYAVVLGFLASTCSHGILALALEIHKKGASNAAVAAFLLASPWASMPLTLLLFGFFGVKALFFVLGAMVVAVNTGLVFQVLERHGIIGRRPGAAPPLGVAGGPPVPCPVRASGLRALADVGGILRASLSLADRVMFWVLLGVGLAAAAAAAMPPEWMRRVMGPTIVGMAATLGVASLIEVCSEGSAPLAFEIYRQTGAFGNAFVFLMAGVVTDISEIGLVWSNIGRRTAVLIPLVSVPQVFVLGMIANHFFAR